MMADGGLQRAHDPGTMRTQPGLSTRTKETSEEEAERCGIEPLWEKKGWRPSAFHLTRNRFAPWEAERSFPGVSSTCLPPGFSAPEEASFVRPFSGLRAHGFTRRARKNPIHAVIKGASPSPAAN